MNTHGHIPHTLRARVRPQTRARTQATARDEGSIHAPATMFAPSSAAHSVECWSVDACPSPYNVYMAPSNVASTRPASACQPQPRAPAAGAFWLASVIPHEQRGRQLGCADVLG